MFVEKIEHLYLRVEIKTLKSAVDFPCNVDPKTPYPSPPSISFSCGGQIPTTALLVTSPSFPINYDFLKLDKIYFSYYYLDCIYKLWNSAPSVNIEIS
jgi:hypothetical protein